MSIISVQFKIGWRLKCNPFSQHFFKLLYLVNIGYIINLISHIFVISIFNVIIFVLSFRNGDLWRRGQPECWPSSALVPGTCHTAGIRLPGPGRGHQCPGQQHGECPPQGGGSGLPGPHHHYHCRESMQLIPALQYSCDMTIIFLRSTVWPLFWIMTA